MGTHGIPQCVRLVNGSCCRSCQHATAGSGRRCAASACLVPVVTSCQSCRREATECSVFLRSVNRFVARNATLARANNGWKRLRRGKCVLSGSRVTWRTRSSMSRCCRSQWWAWQVVEDMHTASGKICVGRRSVVSGLMSSPSCVSNGAAPGCQVLHAGLLVATRRDIRWQAEQLMLDERPGAKTMTRCRARCKRSKRTDRSVRDASQNRASETGAHTLLQWVETTSHIKSLRYKNEAALAGRRLLAKSRAAQLEDSLTGDGPASTEVLRKARIRLDIAATLVWRLWQTKGDAVLHVWTDSSPQRKGLDHTASTWEVFSSERRYVQASHALHDFGTMSCAGHCTDAWHSCCIAFLLVVPVQLHGFCRKIRAFVKDVECDRGTLRTCRGLCLRSLCDTSEAACLST